MTIAFRCPACALDLAEDTSGYVCTNGHRFDRAKEGYVNLLPGGRLKGRPAGDDDSMVRARRAVFDAGLYDPIIQAVADTIERVGVRGDDTAALRLLDCGCGEGSYLAAAAKRTSADAWGIDVSKPAIRLAARRRRDHHYAVASSYQLPFADACFDVALSVFSPRPYEEMMRVLDSSGVAVIVRPGPDHLAELKALVYDDPRRHADPAAAEGEEWPVAVREVTPVSFTLDLGDATLRLALLEMTPFWWSARPEHRASIAATPLTVLADMRISVFGHGG